MSDSYLIFSYEHRAWWRPGRCGYTTNVNEAGEYNAVAAAKIVENANRHRPLGFPNEDMISPRLARSIASLERARLLTELDALVVEQFGERIAERMSE